jgi:L-ascorbate metabolism protein UlaG (beta-lactamase superfamily)
MAITLDWLGCATFRLTINDLVVFLDAFMDLPPGAPDTGMSTAKVDKADFIVVGHSHFDHLWGAERIARNTGATVIGSHESIRLMRDEEVPEEQCIAAAGGERIKLSDEVRVRVFPSQHSCIWARMSAPDEACLGDMGLTLQERTANLAARQARRNDAATNPNAEAQRAYRAQNRQRPRGEGGALAYLFETPEGTILYKDTSGHWTGIMRDLRPDVALLAAAGRGNIDGEPIQGSLSQFVAREVDLLRPRRVIISHHDDWNATGVDPERTFAPVQEELKRQHPRVDLVKQTYQERYPLLAGVR